MRTAKPCSPVCFSSRPASSPMLPHADTHSRIEHFASRYHHWALLSCQSTEHDSNGCGGVSGQTHGELLLPAAPFIPPSMLAAVVQAAVLLGRCSCRARHTCLHHFGPAWNVTYATQTGSRYHAFDSRCLSDEAASMYPSAFHNMSCCLDFHQADPSMPCSACVLTSAACTHPIAAALWMVMPLPSSWSEAEWGPKEHREPIAQALGWRRYAFTPFLCLGERRLSQLHGSSPLFQ